MKKLFLAGAVALMGVFNVNAQEVKFGAKAGLNMSSLKYSEDVEKGNDLKSRIGFHVGAMAEIKLTDKFAVQPELIYSTQGNKVESKGEFMGASYDTKVKQNLDYINIPVMAKYFIMDGLSLEVGPQLGILVSSKIITEGDIIVNGVKESVSETEDIKKDINSIDVGVNAGIGYTMNNLNFGLRYNLGLMDIAKDRESGDKQSVKNGVFQFSVGYFF